VNAYRPVNTRQTQPAVEWRPSTHRSSTTSHHIAATSLTAAAVVTAAAAAAAAAVKLWEPTGFEMSSVTLWIGPDCAGVDNIELSLRAELRFRTAFIFNRCESVKIRVLKRYKRENRSVYKRYTKALRILSTDTARIKSIELLTT